MPAAHGPSRYPVLPQLSGHTPSALVIVISKTTFIAPGATEETPALWHRFGLGPSALRASLSGWHTRGMAGFDQESTRKELNTPAGYELHAAVAIGTLGDKASLPDYLLAREIPSPRRPLVTGGDLSL